MSKFLQDLRYALRSLRRAPTFTAIAVLTLALGIGANTTLFNVLDALLFRPPPGMQDPGSLVRLRPGSAPETGRPPTGVAFTYPDFANIRDNAPLLQGIAAYALSDATLDSGAEATLLNAIFASGNYFEVLGVQPAAGRFFDAAEDRAPGDGPLVVLSHAFWNDRYRQDPRILGTTIRINDVPLTVVGVAPPDFVGADLGNPDVWIPLTMAATQEFGGEGRLGSNMFWLQAIGRMNAGGDATRMTLAVPGVESGDRRIAVEPLRSIFYTEHLGENPVPLWVLALTTVVLLIACANVANLLLARAAGRGHEVAVRLALGASRWRVVRQLLTEGLVLALGAAIAALLLTLGSRKLLLLLPIPPLGPLFSGRTVLFTLFTAALATLFFALAPALWAVRGKIGSVLKSQTGSPSHRSALRNTLVVSQIALSCVLLIVGGLFTRSLYEFRSLDPGFPAEQLLLLSPNFVRGGPQSATRIFDETVLDQVRRVPGVHAAATAYAVPYESNYRIPLEIPTSGADQPQRVVMKGNRVGADYFHTVGIGLSRGRLFDSSDRAGAPPVMIVSERMAREFWPDSDPLGQCVQVLPGRNARPCWTIVGVVADIRHSELNSEPEPFFYLPSEQPISFSAGIESLIVRTVGNSREMAESVRQAAQDAIPGPISLSATPIQNLIDREALPWRVASGIIGTLGALVLFLVAVGVYVVVAFLGVQRTREIGIRVALGASPGHIVRLLLGGSLALCVSGLGLGLLAALLATRLIEAELYGVRAFHAPTYLAAVLLLIGVSALASYVPARRGTRIQAADALRHE